MKEIPVATGYVALVDDDDYATLSAFKWHHVKNRTTVYAYTRVHGKQTPMHAMLVPKADHENHNGLDNRRHNLRPTDGQSQNLMNMTKTTSPTSSKYKGVCWHKAAKKWMASIKLHQKPIYIGLFAQERDAAEAYNKSAQHLFGEFANLNVLEAL